ncbi:MAG: NUDIX domain-containing protein, partial [Mycobacterium leprae]
MAQEEFTWVRETRNGAYGVCIVDGRVLVIRKAKGPYKGLYDLPGGGIEFGEA